MNRDLYATVEWGVRDIQEHRPGWSDKRCREFLAEYEQDIWATTEERGRQYIVELLSMVPETDDD